MPASGYVSYDLTMPKNQPFPVGTLFPFQVLVGNEVSNLEIMELK